MYSDVFSLFIPELKDLIGFQQNNPYHAYDVFDYTVHAIEKCESGDLVVRLAVFFHDLASHILIKTEKMVLGILKVMGE